MIVGDKELATPAPSSRDDLASRAVALVIAVLAAALVAWVVRLGRGNS
jgi:hypothetical protein